MDFNILFVSLIVFILSTILYSILKKNKTLKSLLEIIMGASLVVSLFYLLI